MTQTKFQVGEIILVKSNHEFGIIRDFEQNDDSEHYYVEFLDISAVGTISCRYRWIISIELDLSLN